MADDRKRILALVYNDIRRDARVFRMSRALAAAFRVQVLSVAPRTAAPPPEGGFELTEVRLDHTRGTRRLKYVLFWLAAVAHGARQQYDAVHCHDVYPLPAAALLAACKRVPLVYDAHELVDHRELRPTMLGRFWNWCHRWAVRRADFVITPTEERAEFLVTRGYSPRRPPVTIMNLADPPAVPDGGVSREELGLSDSDHVVVYQGYVAEKRFCLELVQAFAHLSSNHKLVMIGDGPAASAVREAIHRLGLDGRVLTTGYLPKSKVLEYLRVADVGVMLYDGRILNNYYCAPNKLYDYAHFHLPVLGNDLPSIRRVLEQWHIGVVAPARPSPSILASAILQLQQQSFSTEDFDGFLAARSWESEVGKLQVLFAHEVLGGSSPVHR